MGQGVTEIFFFISTFLFWENEQLVQFRTKYFFLIYYYVVLLAIANSRGDNKAIGDNKMLLLCKQKVRSGRAMQYIIAQSLKK